MKRHLSHSPHQVVQATLSHLAEGAVAAAKDVVVLVESAEGLRHPDLAAIAQEARDDELVADALTDGIGEQALGPEGLAPLMVDVEVAASAGWAPRPSAHCS